MTPRANQQGFTLIEAMITIALLAILTNLAVSSYRQYVVRSHRSEAIEGLMAASACQERLLIRNNNYTAGQCGGATSNGEYVIAVTTSNANQNFVATATPQGAQAEDGCGAMAINDAGVKSAHGETGAMAQTCWAGRSAIVNS